MCDIASALRRCVSVPRTLCAVFLSPESNGFHAAAGIFASSAGIMCPQTIEASTDVKSYEDGVGVVHFTSSGEQASLLAAKLADVAEQDRRREVALDVRLLGTGW